jgi:transcriptional regulator GlxA family with amidase domain
MSLFSSVNVADDITSPTRAPYICDIVWNISATIGVAKMHSSEPSGKARLSVGILLLPDFTLMAFAGFVEALRLAADDGDGSRQINCQWTIIGPDQRPVRSSCGVEVTPWEIYPSPDRYDYIVVVGGLLHTGHAPATSMTDYLQRAAKNGVKLVGLCTGVFLMIRAGLMKGRRCCVSWYHYQDLIDEFPEVEPIADQLFVADGNRITCAGGAGAVDLAAWLIERHCGRAWAQKSLRILVIDKARAPNSSQPQPPAIKATRNERVRRAMLLMEQHVGDPLSVEEIARRVNISKRQLERIFRQEIGKSPHEVALELRLNYGQWLLTRTTRPITEIAAECGFADSSHFSRAYRGAFGVPPSATRANAEPATSPLLDSVW